MRILTYVTLSFFIVILLLPLIALRDCEQITGTTGHLGASQYVTQTFDSKPNVRAVLSNGPRASESTLTT